MLERWGRFAARRHWTVILAWLVVVGGVWAAAIALGGEAQNDFTLPGSSSQDALDLLEDEFPPAAGTSATVVYHSPAGTDMTQDTGLQQAIQASLSDLSKLDGVANVVGPFRNNDALFSSETVAMV